MYIDHQHEVIANFLNSQRYLLLIDKYCIITIMRHSFDALLYVKFVRKTFVSWCNTLDVYIKNLINIHTHITDVTVPILSRILL